MSELTVDTATLVHALEHLEKTYPHWARSAAAALKRIVGRVEALGLLKLQSEYIRASWATNEGGSEEKARLAWGAFVAECERLEVVCAECQRVPSQGDYQDVIPGAFECYHCRRIRRVAEMATAH